MDIGFVMAQIISNITQIIPTIIGLILFIISLIAATMGHSKISYILLPIAIAALFFSAAAGTPLFIKHWREFLVFVIFAIITGIVTFYILQSTSEEDISIDEQINNENKNIDKEIIELQKQIEKLEKENEDLRKFRKIK